jgi:NAD(P)-dependent dehydrogenase (short-subunit alcohol dehydrogenase family)
VSQAITAFPHNFRAVVLGSSGALGQAFVQLLAADPRCASVMGFCRSSAPALFLEDEPSIIHCAQEVASGGAVHLVIDATGALVIDGRGPEKRLEDISAEGLVRAMQVNAIGPALLMKHFVPLMVRDQRCVFASLSARVGSIEDNHKGGWYSYRASKAALNMLIQSTAIEVHRKRPLAVFAALQPGTVQSRLTQAFVDQASAMAPLDSAARLLHILENLPSTGRAHFVDYEGRSIPW